MYRETEPAKSLKELEERRAQRVQFQTEIDPDLVVSHTRELECESEHFAIAVYSEDEPLYYFDASIIIVHKEAKAELFEIEVFDKRQLSKNFLELLLMFLENVASVQNLAGIKRLDVRDPQWELK